MEERREDYPEILKQLMAHGDKISKIEKSVNGGLSAQFEDLKQHNKENHLENRKAIESLSYDFKDFSKIIHALPCVSHDKDIGSLLKNNERFWGWVIANICVFLLFFGTLMNYKAQVDNNIKRLDKIDAKQEIILQYYGEHRAMEKSVK